MALGAILAPRDAHSFALPKSDIGSWNKAQDSLIAAIETLDTKRNRLEPVFNPEDPTMIQIIKGERGEQLIEAFRTNLVELANATAIQNYTRTAQVQKKALLALADVGGECRKNLK